MKTRRLSRYSILALLAVLMVWAAMATACRGPNIPQVTRRYSLGPGDQTSIPLTLGENDRLDLSIAVKDEDTLKSATQEPQNIGIMVVDPDGKYVVSYMRVGSGDFMVLAEKEGEFVITLDNSYSSLTKTVTVSMRYPES